MTCSETVEKESAKSNSMIATETPALEEFKAGLVRSMKQYNAGLIKTFDDVDDLLKDLHNPD